MALVSKTLDLQWLDKRIINMLFSCCILLLVQSKYGSVFKISTHLNKNEAIPHKCNFMKYNR